MKKIAVLEKNEREVLFSRTAEKMSLHPSIVEKDFWVCFMLDHLFHDCKYRDTFVFKGGTSLSKSYHVIERFSEDIDLIFDWRKLTDNTDPWDDRSKTKQDKYNKTINEKGVWGLPQKGWNLKCSVACKILDIHFLNIRVQVCR